MCDCNAGYDQYHGVFTCRKCKEVVLNCSHICKVGKDEIEAREKARDLTKEEK